MERILVFILLRETNPSVLRASFPRHTHICFASQFEPPPRQRKKSETRTTTTKVVFHMRLRFLGDQPPHPFFLDDVSRVLSLKLSCVRVFLLTKECCVRIGNVVDDDARTTTSIKEDLTDETTTPRHDRRVFSCDRNDRSRIRSVRVRWRCVEERTRENGFAKGI